MKRCPFCAEEIQDDAIKCKYCGEFLQERPLPQQSGAHVPVQHPISVFPGEIHNSLGVLFLTFITFGIYGFIWIYRVHKELREHSKSGYDISPGTALGLSLIPFFQVIWMTYLLIKISRKIKENEIEDGIDPKKKPGHTVVVSPFLILIDCLGSIAIYIFFVVITAGIGGLFPILGTFWFAYCFAMIQRGLNEHWELRTHYAQTLAEEKPLFCSNCGSKLSEDSIFCEKCGTKIQ